MLHPHLQVGREGVWQAHAAGEGRQDEVAQLDARGRDDVAEAQVVVAQELREVVQQHQKGPEHALVQQADGLQKRRPVITRHGEFEMSRQAYKASLRGWWESWGTGPNEHALPSSRPSRYEYYCT